MSPLTTPLLCVLLFGLWTMALVLFGIATTRTVAWMSGKMRAEDFRADKPQLSERFQRLQRAHLNCVENLPLFTAVVLVAHVVGLRSALVDQLCVAVVVARVGQSLAHIASTRFPAVVVRFSCFLVQVGSFIAISVMLIQGA